MKHYKHFFGVVLVALLGLLGCSVKLPVTNEYQISSFYAKKISNKPHAVTLKITQPDATSAFATGQMRYIKQPYQLESFVKNAWVEPPANMLYPVIVQSMQQTGFFHAVLASPYVHDSDYQLDTQLLGIVQNFIKKPSVLQLSVKVSLTKVASNKVIASKIFTTETTCDTDTPYAGVVAANKASMQLTHMLINYVIFHIKMDRSIARK